MRACRICMTRYDLTPLFGALSVVKFSSHQLLLVTGIKIEPNDGLPQSACRKCIKFITKALDLRELCSKVDQMFRTIITEHTAIKTEHSDFENNDFLNNLVDTGPNDNTYDTNDNFEQYNTNEFHHETNNTNSIYIDIKPTVKCDVTYQQSTTDIKNILKQSADDEDSKMNFGKIIKAESLTTTNTRHSENPKMKGTTTKKKPPINVNKIEPVRKKNSKTNAKSKFIKQFSAQNLTEEEIAAGKISDITIQDVISSEALEELFETKGIREKDSACNMFNGEGAKQTKDREKEALRCISKREAMRVRDRHLMSLAAAPHPHDRRATVRCKLCNSHVQKASFKTHAKKHFAPEFACQTCGKKFHSRHHMQYHRQRMHGEQKRLACSQCSYRAVDRLALRNHERAEHTGERPFVCDECGGAFRMRNNIVQHMKMHFGIRKIQCEHCPTMVKTRSQLWSHQMKVHYMTYTYHCYLCPETYKASPAVRKHLLNVHGVPREQQPMIKCVKTRKEEAPSTFSGSTHATSVSQPRATSVSKSQNLCPRSKTETM